MVVALLLLLLLLPLLVVMVVVVMVSRVALLRLRLHRSIQAVQALVAVLQLLGARSLTMRPRLMLLLRVRHMMHMAAIELLGRVHLQHGQHMHLVAVLVQDLAGFRVRGLPARVKSAP